MLGLRLGRNLGPRTLSAKHSCRLVPRKGPRTWVQPTFKIMGAPQHGSPHGLYRALILAHGQRVAWPPKWAFTGEYGHAVSLLIMVCF